MVEYVPRRGVLEVVWIVAFVCLTLECKEAMAQAADPAPAEKSAAAPAPIGYELTLANPTATQTFEAEPSALRGQTFVEIEETHVENPNRVPLSLTVHAETPRRGQVYLGNFNVGDRPNKFLVATQGTLQVGGKLKVTLLPLATVTGDEGIRVQLKRFALTSR